MKMPWKMVSIIPGGPEIGTSVRGDETSEIRKMAHGRCLDIGTAEGYSAILMALSENVTSVVTTDLFEPHISNKFRPVPQDTFHATAEAYGLTSKIRIMKGDSRIMLPLLFKQGFRFDFIFVDGGHEEPAWSDILWARELCAPGGAIACHDYLNDSTPQVKQAVETWFPETPFHITGSMWVRDNHAGTGNQ